MRKGFVAHTVMHNHREQARLRGGYFGNWYDSYRLCQSPALLPIGYRMDCKMVGVELDPGCKVKDLSRSKIVSLQRNGFLVPKS